MYIKHYTTSTLENMKALILVGGKWRVLSIVQVGLLDFHARTVAVDNGDEEDDTREVVEDGTIR